VGSAVSAPAALERGREAFRRRAWAAAHDLLHEADGESPLEPEDLERASRAAYLTGRDEDSFALLERAFHARMGRGDPEGAALDGFWLVFGLTNRGDWARAGGWVGRARGVIEGRDCVAHGYLTIPEALQALMGGQAETAYAGFSAQRETGRRFGDRDLETLGSFGQGQALVEMGRVDEGIAVLDEAMVAVTGGETSEAVAGLVYCGVIAVCMETFDTRRAAEWTTALSHWCDAQPDLVPFRGQCLVHRAQLMRLHGDWTDALEELTQAVTRFGDTGHPAVGDAVYEQADVRRLHGNAEAAEAAYRQAAEFGRDAQPGLALLRLAQGRADAASAGIRRALDEGGGSRRPRLLSAAVEIALACGHVTAARTAADELAALAAARGVQLLSALSAQATGAVLLAEGDAGGALAAARRAWAMWHALGVPYEAARARVVVAGACRALGDEDACAMEVEAARRVFERLGAAPDLAGIGALTSGRPDAGRTGLTAREVEVLRALATGRTNRAIAVDLVLSEKTVARHVSNIFAKLGLSSRAAATAYAYEHGLV